jgi:predicted phosphate transport protein (TIGR00153 family)
MVRKKEINYFDVLIKAASYANQAAVALEELLNNYVDVAVKANAIHELEHAADDECHRLTDALNIAFITPIDREDLYGMIKSIDDITDHIEDVSNRFDMFNILVVRPEAIQMSKLIVRATSVLYEALMEFKTFKKSTKVHDLIKDINTIEGEGDRLYRKIVKSLFTENELIVDIIKWKDIYDDMENVLDSCEDVADIIEGVLMKNY